MKPKVTSSSRFSAKQIAGALATAAKRLPDDPDSPRSKRGDWSNAIVSHSLTELRAKLAVRRADAKTATS